MATTVRIKDVKFEDFDPNDLDRAMPAWAVFKGSQFKTYLDRGHAINAFLCGSRAKLYERANGRWAECAMKEPRPRGERCDGCTLDTDYGGWVFDRRGGKLIEPLVLLYCCSECKHRVVRS